MMKDLGTLADDSSFAASPLRWVLFFRLRAMLDVSTGRRSRAELADHFSRTEKRYFRLCLCTGARSNNEGNLISPL